MLSQRRGDALRRKIVQRNRDSVVGAEAKLGLFETVEVVGTRQPEERKLDPGQAVWCDRGGQP